jgi:alanine dehydrogenase
MPKKGASFGVRVLSATDVAALLSPAESIAAVEDAFGRWARGDVDDPAVLGVHVDGGAFHIKAGAMRIGLRTYFATKTNGNFPGNPERRALPSIQGVIVLSDAESGTPLAIMDSARITELRTAAATAVAVRHLARSDASRVVLIGCGAQAPSHLKAIREVRSISRLVLIDRDSMRAKGLAQWASSELGVPAEVAASPADAVPDADICVTCTPSTRPILMADMVRSGTFVAAVGADNPSKHEIEPRLMAANKVVVDSLDQCASMGDLHHALEARVMRREDVHAELGDVVAGARPGREREDEIIVFDSTGTALQDVAAAALVFERAIASARGIDVELAPPS